jgi:hypothetical protein
MSLTKTQVSPLQIYSTRNFTGLTDSNHLSNAYLTKPETVGSILSYASGYQEDNVLTLLTGGIGNTLTVNNREYDWELHSQSERTIEVVFDSPQASSGTPGIGGTPFQIYFGENWFDNSDNIVADDQTTYHIVEEPFQEGAYWVVTVVANDIDPTTFADVTVVNTGARFSKDYSTVPEYSPRGGGVSYSTPYKLQNQLTTLRKTYNVTRNAAKAVMVLEMTSPDGKKTKLWTKLAEWTAMSEWYKEIDRSMIYSIYNKNARGEVKLQGDNGRSVYHGAGLRQQIAPANIRFYSELTYDILDQFLLDLSYDTSKWGGNYKFVALTGKMGMREFNRAITDHAKGNNITVTNSGTFISGSGDSLTFTGYFKTVEFLNGVSLTVKEFPPYDDIIRNRLLHPKTLKPVESYRFTILNFGQNKEGKSNIKKVAMAESEMAYWHVAGSTDPMGGVAKSVSTARASGIDGYEVHFLSECGIMIEDPTSCGELILAID